MTLSRVFTTLCLLALTIVIGGCASRGVMVVQTSQVAVGLSARPSLGVTINAIAENSAEVVPNLTKAVVAQLKSSGRYSEVTTEGGTKDLLMTIDIVNYHKVSFLERNLTLGARNLVDTKVTIRKVADNVVLKELAIKGESGVTTFSTTNDAVKQVVEQLAAVAVN